MKQAVPIETNSAAAAGRTPSAASAQTPDLDDLIRQHRELDERLQELTACGGHLTPDQQREAAVMKKRKLALKDRIAFLAASS